MANSGALKFVVFVGSVREGRLGERILKLFLNNARSKFENRGYTFEVIDAKVEDLQVLKRPLHFHKDVSEAPAVLRKLNEIIENADGYFLVTAEYNRSPCPGLVNLMDHFPIKSYAYKPSGIISYSPGMQGGVLAGAGLRPLIAELNMVSVRNHVAIGQANQTVTEDGQTSNEHVVSAMDKLVEQVAWWADACKTKRNKDGNPKI